MMYRSKLVAERALHRGVRLTIRKKMGSGRGGEGPKLEGDEGFKEGKKKKKEKKKKPGPLKQTKPNNAAIPIPIGTSYLP